MNPCYICLEEISDNNEETEPSPCECNMHVHKSCMQTWLKKSNNEECPNCQRKLRHTFDVVIEPQGFIEAQEYIQELEEMNRDIHCVDRFLYTSRVLFYALGIYIVVILALGTTDNLNIGQLIVFTVVMLGPPTIIWSAFLVYFTARRMMKCCTERRSQQIVPGIV